MKTDSLYYIMDYSGNYYRVNKENQLVVSANSEEATVFTFAQANDRICGGKKSAFYCIIPIDGKNDPVKDKRVTEKTVKEPKDEHQNTDLDKEKEVQPSSIKELLLGEIQESSPKSELSYDLSEIDWTEYLTHFTYVASTIADYKDELSKKQSDIDQKICDILHYIELCETNNEEAVDLVELLRVCRENRRNIKDEMLQVECFQNNLGTSANVAKAKQALKGIEKLETRTYKPRKYEDLFENYIMKDKQSKKSDLDAVATHTDNKRLQNFANRAYEYTEEGGEDNMTDEKKYTPYDGKENDWLSFARQQAEFYRNAGQYISNLQITVNEIDQEIEDILQETEAANCNVAQGYKVFKRLKELRLERKAKTQELNCLYALTDYIDCNALADICEDNLAEIKNILNVSAENDTPTPNIKTKNMSDKPEET